MFDLGLSQFINIILNNPLSKMLAVSLKLASVAYSIGIPYTSLSVSLRKVLEGTELGPKRPHLKCLQRLSLNHWYLTALLRTMKRLTRHQFSQLHAEHSEACFCGNSTKLGVREVWFFCLFCPQLLIHMVESYYNLSFHWFPCLLKGNEDACEVHGSSGGRCYWSAEYKWLCIWPCHHSC